MERKIDIFSQESSESLTHSGYAFAKELARQIVSGEVDIYELSDDQIRLLQKLSPDGEVELRQYAA